MRLSETIPRTCKSRVNKRNKGLLGSLIKVGFNDAVSSERLLNQCIKGKIIKGSYRLSR